MVSHQRSPNYQGHSIKVGTSLCIRQAVTDSGLPTPLNINNHSQTQQVSIFS